MKKLVLALMVVVLGLSFLPMQVAQAQTGSVPGFPDMYPVEEVTGYLMADKMPVMVIPLDKDFFYSYYSDYRRTVPAEIRTYEVSGVELGYKNLYLVPDPDNQQFFEKLEEKVLDKLTEVKLNPSAFGLIKKIKTEGGRIGVLTSSKRVYVESAMKEEGLLDIVDVLLCKEDVVEGKPDPEIINKALGVIGGSLKETVMIGDTWWDVLASKNAGVTSVLYYPERYRQFYNEDFQLGLGAEFVIGDFSEFEI